MTGFFVWIVLPIILVILGIILCVYDWDFGAVIAFVAFVILFFSIFFTCATRINVHQDLAGFEQVRTAVVVARQTAPIAELAAITQTIATHNKWLAETQWFANLPTMDLFYPKRLYTTEMIK